jgi:hypothetical protein
MARGNWNISTSSINEILVNQINNGISGSQSLKLQSSTMPLSGADAFVSIILELVHEMELPESNGNCLEIWFGIDDITCGYTIDGEGEPNVLSTKDVEHLARTLWTSDISFVSQVTRNSKGLINPLQEFIIMYNNNSIDFIIPDLDYQTRFDLSSQAIGTPINYNTGSGSGSYKYETYVCLNPGGGPGGIDVINQGSKLSYYNGSNLSIIYSVDSFYDPEDMINLLLIDMGQGELIEPTDQDILTYYNRIDANRGPYPTTVDEFYSYVRNPFIAGRKLVINMDYRPFVDFGESIDNFTSRIIIDDISFKSLSAPMSYGNDPFDYYNN